MVQLFPERSIYLLLAVLLLPISLALAGDASAESDIELAKEIAQVEVAKNVGDYPEWEGAEATGGQPYCNLEGDVICYWFAASKEGDVLGSSFQPYRCIASV